MKITIEKTENRLNIALNVKKFDVSNMQDIKKEIQETLENSSSDVYINLSDVSFVDSSGLSVLIAVFKQLNGSEYTLTLCGLQEQPMELLEITQLHKVFTISDTCTN